MSHLANNKIKSKCERNRLTQKHRKENIRGS